MLREQLHPAGRQRIAEPMVMNDPDSVAQFHAAGGSNLGIVAVYDFGARALDALVPPGGRLLDLGVGSGRALSAVLRRRPDLEATAVDLSPNMLATARELFATEGLDQRVELVQADITALPDRLATSHWDAVSCMWTLHQLPDFDTLRAALRQIAVLRRRTGAAVWISDLQRLRDPSAADAMYRVLDPSLPAAWRRDAIASEAAAFTRAELSAELAAAGLDDVRCGYARGLQYLQAYWIPSAHPKPSTSTSVRRSTVHGRARLAAALHGAPQSLSNFALRWMFSPKPF